LRGVDVVVDVIVDAIVGIVVEEQKSVQVEGTSAERNPYVSLPGCCKRR